MYMYLLRPISHNPPWTCRSAAHMRKLNNCSHCVAKMSVFQRWIWLCKGPHNIGTLHREIDGCPRVYNTKECNTSMLSARGEPERVECKLFNQHSDRLLADRLMTAFQTLLQGWTNRFLFSFSFGKAEERKGFVWHTFICGKGTNPTRHWLG